ncbi:MAG TPA: SUF system Fe-S cluster assembly protein [Alphaproteobacteria bacterium]|nr:SUF system Fe-S cluster assembly protein [Alphaproteobacteria bacterium]
MSEETKIDTVAETPALATADANGDDGLSLADKVVRVLNTIHDPEIPVNIYELGLVYDVDVAQDGEVNITMTLTTPNCPVAGSMPAEVETKVGAIEGVTKAHVNLVWEPTWTPERMSEAAKLELGWL